MINRNVIKFITLILTASLTLPLPLNGLVVYAQDTGSEDEVDTDHVHELPTLALADIPAISDPGDGPETPLTRTFSRVNSYTITPDASVPDNLKDNPFTTVISTGQGVINNGLYVELNPVDLVLMGALDIDGSADAGTIPAGRPEPEDDEPDTSSAADEQRTLASITDPVDRSTVDPETALTAFKKMGFKVNRPSFAEYVEKVNTDIRPFISSEIRLSISQTDKIALTGENSGDCATWNQADDDFFANEFCDPPRVSREIVRTLHYLLTPKEQGGAGREYLKVDHIVDYQKNSREEDDPEDSVFGSGLNGPHYVNFATKPDKITDASGVTRYTFNINQQDAFSHAIDVSAIDRIRITTRIQKKGIFSKSTKFRFNSPTPIKVAWQSDSGIAKEPLPTISTDELVNQLGAQSILDMLGESDALEDPSFAGRPLESIGLGDIARFLGGRLLSQLLSGQDIGQFNFEDTVKDFGVIAIAGALNLDPEVVRRAHSLEELEELTGRSWVGQQINLSSPIQGTTLNEILADIGRQRLGALLGVKGYALANYSSVDEFKIRLGQGLLEERLPVPEKSFEPDTKDAVRGAVGAGRFDLIFKEDQASEIDERLGIETGPTLSFIRGGTAVDYKRQIGAEVFDRTIGKYNLSQGDDATPLHPYSLYEQLMSNGTTVGGNGAQGIGTLAHLRDTVGEMLDPNNRYGQSLLTTLPSESPSGSGITRTVFTDSLHLIYNNIDATISALQPFSKPPVHDCPGVGATPIQRTCPAKTSGEKYYATPEEAITARNSFESLSPLLQNRLLDAIDAANNVNLAIMGTTAQDWATVSNQDQPTLRGLSNSLNTVANTTALSDFNLSLPRNNSIFTTSEIFGGTTSGNPKTAVEGISSELKSALNAIRSYDAAYGAGNPTGYESANRRDQYFNFPAGTLYSAIGGQSEEAAFADIGIWTLSQRLANQDEQVLFRTRVNIVRLQDSDLGGPSFTPSSAEHQYLADVFLTVRPADEFRRIGRSLLVDRVKNSAQATSVTNEAKKLDVVQDVLFYTERLQIINAGVETIRQAAADLNTTTGSEITALAAQLNSLLSPPSFTRISVTAVTRTVREKKGQLNQLRRMVENETTLPQINSRVLPALRNIERAAMEIMEGKPLNYTSGIPSEISLGINNSSKGNNQVGGSCDAPNADLLNSARRVIGTDNFTDIFGGDDLVLNSLTGVVANGGANLDDTLRFIGSAKLGDLLELPQSTFDVYFGPGIDKTSIDDLFYSVGVGHIMARCNTVGSLTRAELVTAGREYIARVSIPALANKLGITLPDWMQPEDLAGLVIGNPSDVLFGIGARQVEERLGFQSGFVRAVVMPEGATEVERQHNRERSIIQASLLKLDIELPLPAGFTLSENPVESMGRARIEQVFNLPSGTFYFDPAEMYPEREAIFRHLVDYYRDQYVKAGYDSSVANSTAEISGRERFINTFGVGLDDDGRKRQQSASLALSAWANSDESARTAKVSALQTAQSAYVESLDAVISQLMSGQYPVGRDYADEYYRQDATSRYDFFEARLRYLDNTLGISSGTTQKWLTVQGGTTTTNFIKEVGSGSAEVLASSGLAAGLRRMGVEGQWFDTITQPDNISLVRSVFTSDQPPSSDQWSRLFNMFSTMFSINLDDELGFDVGTLARVIAHPTFADEILVDQGVRLFSSQVLGIDLESTEYDQSINLKRVVQAAMYGAAVNPNTGRFEAMTFEGGVQLQGDLAVVYAMGEVNDIALEYLTTQIRGESGAGDDLWRFMRVPVTFIHDVVNGRLETIGLRSNYMQEAVAARQAWDDNADNPINQSRVVKTADSHRLTVPASGFQPSFGGQNPNDNMWQDLGSIISSGKTVAPNGSTQSPDLIAAQADASRNDDGLAKTGQAVGAATNPGTGSYHPLTTSAPGNAAATTNLQGADSRQQVIDMQRAAFKDAATYLFKEVAYAAMDFGIEKLFNFEAGIIAPGISRALIEGNPQQRMNAIFYIGAKYALQNLTDEVPDWLRPFADFETLHQAASFILNLDNSAASVQAAFQPGGLFSKVQTAVFPHGLFGELNLPDGVFGAVVGFMLTGSTADFTVNGASFQGLGNLFNTQSLIKIGFDFAEKWLGVDADILWQGYNNTYQLVKAYGAYQAFHSIAGTAQGVIALANQNPAIDQILTDEAINVALDPNYASLTNDQVVEQAANNISNNPAIDAAQTAKAAQLQANLIQAGVTLALFAINLVFGKALNKFESAIGLPPGTIMQAIGLGATAAIQLLIIGSLGPMFWIGLGIFVLMTLFGFGVVKVRVYGTADGYYPLVGTLGTYSSPSPGGQPPYSQWPSADILDSSGKLRTTSITGTACDVTTPAGPDARVVSDRPADCQLGWFDPRDKTAQKENYQYASRVKVMGLVRDLFAGEYSTGVLPQNNTVKWSENDYPTLVFIDKIEEGSEADYYLGASNPYLQPAKLTFNRFNMTRAGETSFTSPDQLATITCNASGGQWGICSNPSFWKSIHIQW